MKMLRHKNLGEKKFMEIMAGSSICFQSAEVLNVRKSDKSLDVDEDRNQIEKDTAMQVETLLNDPESLESTLSDMDLIRESGGTLEFLDFRARMQQSEVEDFERKVFLGELIKRSLEIQSLLKDLFARKFTSEEEDEKKDEIDGIDSVEELPLAA